MELGFSGERKKHHLEFTSAKPDYLHNLQFQAGYDFLQHFYWAFNRLENTNRENSETIWGRILGAQRNLIIHLVIVALRAVAVETESLVGQKLLGASVNGGTDGNTKDNTERDQLGRALLDLAKTLGDSVGAVRLLGRGAVECARGLHTEHTGGIHGERWTEGVELRREIWEWEGRLEVVAKNVL